jgi:hypothetical protein
MLFEIPEQSVEFGNLYEAVISSQIDQGMDQLVAVSGFSSGAFVRHLLREFDHLQLRLIIGMAKKNGIPEPDHSIYRTMVEELNGRLDCRYYVGPRGVHAKAYSWLQNEQPAVGIVGSANLSWNGFKYYDEIATYADPYQVLNIYNGLLTDSLSVTDTSVLESVQLITAESRNASRIAAAHGTPQIRETEGLQTVNLSLLTAQGEMHTSSGLNWGQRDRREPNQAYIPVRRIVHNEHPGFFPTSGQRFTVKTDDGHTMVCVIAQQGDKAIHTPDNNSELGLYLRRRIGVPDGEFVNREDLERYGRADVSFSKIDDEMFLMNFQSDDGA